MSITIRDLSGENFHNFFRPPPSLNVSGPSSVVENFSNPTASLSSAVYSQMEFSMKLKGLTRSFRKTSICESFKEVFTRKYFPLQVFSWH